ncbi:hypothetical protein GCM10028807_13270 [Spirosoma daeguense]
MTLDEARNAVEIGINERPIPNSGIHGEVKIYPKAVKGKSGSWEIYNLYKNRSELIYNHGIGANFWRLS